MASFVHLAGQVVNEYELWDPSTGHRPLEEILTVLRKGALLLKHGRQGKPKVHYFRLAGSDTILKWKSASGSVRQVKLRTVTEVVLGQTTEVFKRYMLRESGLSFSLKYTDDDGSHRTLDLTCGDAAQCEAWYTGLRVVAERLRVTGTPALPAAAAFAAQLGAGGSFSSMLRAAADPGRCYGGGTATGRASGAMGIPVVEHVPGDLLTWGAASRAPQAASTRSAPGPDLWQRSKAPAPLLAGSALDVRCAAVGRLHGILVTAAGSVYTWGEGRGGKLGLGHDQDQATPQRLEQGLRGQCVLAVACGDDCTAAVTDAGTLYMWGRLASAPRPQLVPVPLRGDLHNRIVTRVSCGPFHCAAVSADGALFTWGEGFGGKLGHGDQSCKAQPTLVRGLLGKQVLGVACGVWHTAAIVVEAEGPLAQGLATQAGGTPPKAEHGTASGEQGNPRVDGPTISPGHHRRNSSTSSAFSDGSLFHEGQGGTLYTWGGVNESMYGSGEKRDSNKGCLGHGDADLFSGQLLPTRVSGALEAKTVRQVAAGLHLTVAVTAGGRVFQMGCTGASGGKYCPWEGATSPELVKGPLAGYFVDSVSCGTHHVLALARPLDRKQGRPAEHGPTAVFAWGRGAEGQLGTGKFEDSAAPLLVDALKGRQVLQVACGGCNTLVVCEHDTRRFEPESKEAVEQAMGTLYAMMDQKPPKQLRIQMPEGYAAGALTTSRARSMSVQHSGGSAAIVPYSGAGSLSRAGSSLRTLGGGGRAPSLTEVYATLRSAQRQQEQRLLRPQRLPHSRTDPTPHSGSAPPPPRVLGVPSSFAAASSRRGGMGVSASMPSLSGISHAQSWGGGTEMSSLSSSLRQASEDWSMGSDSHTVGDSHATRPPSIARASMDLAAIDEACSGSIASQLSEALQERDRLIEHLQSKLQRFQRQESRGSSGDSDERLRQMVRASAGQFRDSFLMEQRSSSGRAPSLGRASTAASEPARSAYGEEEREVGLKAMEQMLVRKQVHLETQQHTLSQWAMELQRRELELQRQQAAAEGRPYTAPAIHSAPSAPAALGASPGPSAEAAAGVPPPIPSESPVYLREQRSSISTFAAGSPQVVRTAPAGLASAPERALFAAAVGSGGEQQVPATPPAQARQDAYGMGTPDQAGPLPGKAPNEWMEEIETGVFVTYAIEGNVRKLKRIRFSRTIYSKEGAAKWYEANKHRLVQPTGSPRVAGHHHFSSLPPHAELPAGNGAAPLLPAHGRLGSRNLSFDPTELASMQFGSQHGSQGYSLAGAAGASALGKPSRLSQVSRPVTAPCDEVPEAPVPGPGEGGSGSAMVAADAAPQQQQAAVQQQQQQQQSEEPVQEAGEQPAEAGPDKLRVLPAAPPSVGNSGESPSAARPLSPGSRQLSHLPSDVLSLSTLCAAPSGVLGDDGGSGGGGSGRSSPSKRSSQHHPHPHLAARQNSLYGRPGSSLVREGSRASISSTRSDASRASGQFSPRFVASVHSQQQVAPLERKPSPHAAAISALAASAAAGAALASSVGREQLASAPASPFASAAGASPSQRAATPASAPPRAPLGPPAEGPAGRAGSGGSVAGPSPSRLSRLKAAFSTSKKKHKAFPRPASR